MKWYIKAIKNFADFQGRARRKEYWMFVLFNYIFTLIIGFSNEIITLPAAIGYVYVFGMIVPNLAVSVRRLHDTNRSGWWVLINIIPLVGPIILTVFQCLDSTPGTNKYGPNPKIETDLYEAI
ncbi:DUF805 domain-containing protein [Aciduricibacillus chroicocephali]|uniref:DUF805 domain-containing protein n=1 Tax=Aciduricibacillus chroicocephali TaxID=3054939 RepID=A0ABY9KVK5_9BACI|nr:DUF805 domain-containing protein [Bacillaceae bacterium 44XB]